MYYACMKQELPKKFVNKFGTELGDVAFAVVPNGTIWRIELKKTKTMIWFENGWDKFMDYYSISVGHLLVFKYEGNSVFHVIIFDMSATEIEYPFLTVKVATDTERESSDNEQTTDSQRPRSLFSEQSMNQTNGRALEAAKAFKSKNPVCLIVMRPTHLYNGPVNVPIHFARKYLIGKTRSVILSVKQRTWSVGLYSVSIVGNCYGRLTSGWSNFASDNHLKDGDVCVFDFFIILSPKGAAASSSIKTLEEFPDVDSSPDPVILAIQDMELNYRWLGSDPWSADKVIISLGQLRAGLSFPLYDP
ncbi:B3 domain-containing transcription factor VRN1-like [Papaver somniferum]|uniref:B3 domain-containing transcription factor VRN1-like n=1 Tax=Papaver somniferum TaxID=3469 RepID=UPI000E703C71|nr:B3 domain-containing transcription factor VRN1-like [Papaver somniferum]